MLKLHFYSSNAPVLVNPKNICEIYKADDGCVIGLITRAAIRCRESVEQIEALLKAPPRSIRSTLHQSIKDFQHDYTNNFLTTEGVAEHYEVSVELASALILEGKH